MLLLLFRQAPLTGDVELTLDTTLPALTSALHLESDVPALVGGPYFAERKSENGIRIVTILPAVRSRLLIETHDDDLAVILLSDNLRMRGDI